MPQVRKTKEVNQNEDPLISKMAGMKIGSPAVDRNRRVLGNIGNQQPSSGNRNAGAKEVMKSRVEINLIKAPTIKVEKKPPPPLITVKKSLLEHVLLYEHRGGTQSRFLALQKIGNPNGVKYFEVKSGHSFGSIQDIDKHDKNDCIKTPEYTNDIYAYLMRLENTFMIQPNFMEKQSEITPQNRSILVEWINEVHTELDLSTEAYFLAISIMDQYTQKVNDIPRKKYQLVGTASLFIAAKYEEIYPRKVSEFAYMTDNAYTHQEIIEMEQKILVALDFRLNAPLAAHFYRRYAKASKINLTKYMGCKYFLELASIDYDLAAKKPSELAAAALYLVLYLFNSTKSTNHLWNQTLEFYTTYKVHQLTPTVKKLAQVVLLAVDNKSTHIIVHKYSKSQFEKISLYEEMSGAKLKAMARN